MKLSFFRGFTIILLVTVVFFGLQNSLQVSAQTIAVNTIADLNDINIGDGICEANVGQGNCTLRAAIDEANFTIAIDTITIPAGVYKITKPGTNENQNANGDFDIFHDLNLVGAGSGQTIVDADNFDRIFDVYVYNTGEKADFSAKGMTIKNGYSNATTNNDTFLDASAIRMPYNSLTLDDVKVINNTSVDSQVISVYGTNLTILNSEFSNNSLTSGALLSNIAYDNLTVNIKNTVIANNTWSSVFPYASALSIQGGISGDLDNLTIINNRGGLLYNNSNVELGKTLTLKNSKISNNTRLEDGAGVHYTGIGGNILRIENSEITNNTTSGLGGGIYHEELQNIASGSLYITDTLISGNSANIGGGIATVAGHLNLQKSLIENNTADVEGGGIKILDRYLDPNSNPNFTFIKTSKDIQSSLLTEISNNTFTANTAPRGSAIDYTDNGSNGTAKVVISNNTIVQNNGIGIHITPSDNTPNPVIVGGLFDTVQQQGIQVYTENLIQNNLLAFNSGGNCSGLDSPFSAPILANLANEKNLSSDGTCTGFSLQNTNPKLGPFAINGAVNRLKNFSLLADSPAINSGLLSDCQGIDQLNSGRPLLGGCDIGAYEFSGVLPQGNVVPLPPTNNNQALPSQSNLLNNLIRTGGL
jgi:hypothetical protein